MKAVEFLQAERNAGRPVHEKRRGKQHRMIIKSRVQSLENPRHVLHCLAVTNPLPIPYHQEGQVVSDYLVPRVTMCITSILDVSIPISHAVMQSCSHAVMQSCRHGKFGKACLPMTFQAVHVEGARCPLDISCCIRGRRATLPGHGQPPWPSRANAGQNFLRVDVQVI